MNLVVLTGRIASAPHRVALSSGVVRYSFDLASDPNGHESSAIVPVACSAQEVPDATVEALAVGQQVVIVGSVHRRFFRAGGVTHSRTEVIASEVVPQRARSRVKRLLHAQADRLGAVSTIAVASVAHRASAGSGAGRRREQNS
jgi:single-strand DNA-binding protein